MCIRDSGRLVRWMLILQEYDLTIEYCKGKENIVADVLSRTDFDNNTEVDIANTYKIFIYLIKIQSYNIQSQY